jgi:histidyl-tRNA synthetase
VSQNVQRLRGTKDLCGDEARQWEKLEAAAAAVFTRFGYEPVRTPILEPYALFSRSVGEVTDIVQKEMYKFTDRSGDEVAMRPEGTASVVRAYLQNNLSQERPVRKLYYIGPMFRAERPQAGRLRQFHQIGAEVFGSASAYTDAETMAVLAELLKAAGISRFRFEINNLGSSEDRAAFGGVLVKFFQGKEDKLCKDCQTRLAKNVFRLLDCKNEACRALASDAPLISDHVSDASKTSFKLVQELLTDLKLSWSHNPRIIRGLDYYTHTVFEVKHEGLGAQDALGAGGRYDGLVQTLGGPATPAVGFAVGIERLFLAAAAEMAGVTPEAPPRSGVAIAALGADALRGAFAIAHALRLAGITCHMDLDARSLKAQMRQADRSGARYAVILGSDELAKGAAAVKDLSVSDAPQAEVPLAGLVDFFKQRSK